MYGYLDKDLNYYEGDNQGNDIIIAKRPSLNNVLSDNWKDDPLNPDVCWRTKTAQEITNEEQQDAISKLSTKDKKFLRDIFFDLENRVRKLEGNNLISKNNYTIALIDLYKSILG